LENHLGKIRSTSAKISANPIKLNVTASRDALTNARKDMTALEQGAKQTAFYTLKMAENLSRGATAQSKVTNSLNQTTLPIQRNTVASNVVAPTTQPVQSQNKKHLSHSAMGSSLVAGSALIVPFTASINFETAMADVKAFTKDINDQNFQTLSAKARELGASTEWSATQAGQGMKFLAIAGFSAKQQLQAMRGVLGLATAGTVDLGTSANISSNILSGFSIKAEKMNMVSDILAKTFTTSNTTLIMLGETMKYTAPIASGLGVSITEVSALAGKLGNVGIQASMAGTSLRQIYSRLSAPPKEAEKALTALGVSAYNAKGKFKGVPSIIGELNKAMKGMSQEDKNEKLKHIFGMTALSSGIALLKEGKESLLKYQNILEKSEGTTKKIQAIKLATTMGQFKLLNSAVEGLNISMTLGLLPVVRYLTSGLTGVATALNGFTEKFPTLSKWVFGLTATLILGTVALAGFGLVASGVGSAIAFLATPVTAVTLGILALGSTAVYLYNRFKPVRDVLGGFWDGFKEGIAPLIQSFSAMYSEIKGGLSKLWGFVKPIFGGIGSAMESIGITSMSVGKIIGDAFNLILSPIRMVYGVIKYIGLTLGGVFDGIGEKLSPVATEFKSLFLEIGSEFFGLYNALKPIVNGINSIFSSIGKALSPIFSKIGSKLSLIGITSKSVGHVIGTAFKIVLFPIKLLLKAFGLILRGATNIINSWKTIGKKAGALWSGIVTKIKSPFVSFFKWIESKFSAVMGLVNKVKGLANKVGNIKDKAVSTIKSKASTAWNKTKSFFGFGEEKKESIKQQLKKSVVPVANNINYTPLSPSKDRILKATTTLSLKEDVITPKMPLLPLESPSQITDNQIALAKSENVTQNNQQQSVTTVHNTYHIDAKGADAEEIVRIIKRHEKDSAILKRDTQLDDIAS
jgi:TP901 family phage tail tape measure protein